MNRKEKAEKIREQKFFVRGDIFVFFAVLLVVLIFFAIAFFVPKPSGEQLNVYYRGEKILSVNLSEDAEYVFWIEDGQGKTERYNPNREYRCYNRISVRGGGVRVVESDCPDHTCENFGERRWGEIICVPHGLRIEISGNGLETDV